MSLDVSEDLLGVVRVRHRDRVGGIDHAVLDQLEATLRAVEQRNDVRAVVLEGGSVDFSAHTELRADELPERWRRRAPSGTHGFPPVVEQSVVRLIWNLEVPVIAVLRGTVTDFGFVLACTCDFRIAYEGALMSLGRGDPHAATGAAWLLPRLLGLSRANRFLLLDDVVDAREAEEMGLVHQRVTPDATERFIADVAALPTRSFAAHKRQVHDQLELGFDQALWHSLAVRQTYVIEDLQEGREAFAQRRPPNYTGR